MTQQNKHRHHPVESEHRLSYQSETPAVYLNAEARLPRRTFLIAGAAGAATLMFGSGWLAHAAALVQGGAATAVPAGFMALSRTLTGHKEIDDGLASGAWQALSERERDFAARYARLADAVRKGGLTDMATWKTSAVAASPELKATAVAIVAAWYLGRVGEVLPRAEPGPAFITYAGALMWRPTLDVTVIPTYSRGGPGFWGAKPPGV
jgi:hypothetical protein